LGSVGSWGASTQRWPLDELLQEVGGLDLFPPEAALLAHHEHLERQPRPYGIDQPDEAGPLREFRPADPVIDVDVCLGDRPPLHGRVRARVVDLAGHRLRFLGGASLLAGLTRVDAAIMNGSPAHASCWS
jgi:hypothetical protein